MHPATSARLQLLLAALLFSTGGAAIKGCALSHWQVASFRSGIAALAILVLIPASRRRWNWKMGCVALTYAATMILFVVGNKLTTAANTIFLQSTAPLYIFILSPWLLREPSEGRNLVFMLAIAGGLALLFLGNEPATESAPEPLRGNLLAALCGVTWAFTVMGLRWLGAQSGAGTTIAAVAAGNVCAFLVGLPLALPMVAGLREWIVLGYLGVFQIGLAYFFLTRGIRQVRALDVSLLLLLEPVCNPIWAWIFQNERPGAWATLGGSIILAATVLKIAFDYRRSQGAEL